MSISTDKIGGYRIYKLNWYPKRKVILTIHVFCKRRNPTADLNISIYQLPTIIISDSQRLIWTSPVSVRISLRLTILMYNKTTDELLGLTQDQSLQRSKV